MPASRRLSSARDDVTAAPTQPAVWLAASMARRGDIGRYFVLQMRSRSATRGARPSITWQAAVSLPICLLYMLAASVRPAAAAAARNKRRLAVAASLLLLLLLL